MKVYDIFAGNGPVKAMNSCDVATAINGCDVDEGHPLKNRKQ